MIQEMEAQMKRIRDLETKNEHQRLVCKRRTEEAKSARRSDRFDIGTFLNLEVLVCVKHNVCFLHLLRDRQLLERGSPRRILMSPRSNAS